MAFPQTAWFPTIGNFVVWRKSLRWHDMGVGCIQRILALYPGPGERGLRFTTVHVDVLAHHLASGIDRYDIEHLDLGRERRAARLLERKDHCPFEDPVIVAVEPAAHLERKVELFEGIDAALPQGLPPVDGVGPVMDMEDRVFRMKRGDQVRVPGLPADMIAFEHIAKRHRVFCKRCGCHWFSSPRWGSKLARV